MKIELRTDNYNSKVTWIFYNNRVAIKQPSQTFTLKAMCAVDNNFPTNSQNIYIYIYINKIYIIWQIAQLVFNCRCSTKVLEEWKKI